MFQCSVNWARARPETTLIAVSAAQSSSVYAAGVRGCAAAGAGRSVLEADGHTGGVGGEAFLFGEQRDAGRVGFESLLVVVDDRGPFEEVNRTQAIREAGRPSGGEDVRRAGVVVACRDRGIVAHEDRAGVLDFGQLLIGVGGRDVQMLGSQQIGIAGGFDFIAGENQRAVVEQTLTGEIAAREFAQLADERIADGFDQWRVPGDEDAGTGAVFGLRDQVAGDERGVGGFVGEYDDFTGAGDAVDVDFAEDVTLGEGHEQITGADDFVDAFDAFDAIRECGDGLGAADPVDFGDAEFLAGGEDVGVVAAEIGGWHDDDDLFDAGGLCGDGGHQQCGWIRGRTAGNADADPFEGEVALTEFDAGLPCFAEDFDIVRKQSRLELDDVLADATQRGEVLGLGFRVRFFEFLSRDAHGLGGELLAVELFRVIEERGATFVADIVADLFDDFLRREGFAEEFDRALSAGFRDDIAARAELFAEFAEERGGIVAGAVDGGDVEFAVLCHESGISLLRDAGHGIALGEFRDFPFDGFDVGFVCGSTEDFEDPGTDLFHFVFFHAPGGEGGGSDADAAGIERFALIVGDHVFVDGDAGLVECFFGDFAGEVNRGDVAEHEVVVGSTRSELDAACHQGLGEGSRIGDDLSGVGFEVVGIGFLEADGFAGDDVLEGAALNAGEDFAVEVFGVFLFHENEAGPGTTQGFVSGGGDEVGDFDGVVVHAARDEAGIVGHVDHEDRTDFGCDFRELGVVDFTRVGGGTGDDHFGFVFAGEFGDLVVVDLVIVFTHAVGHGIIEGSREVQFHAVSQVTAVCEVHGEEGVAWFQHGEVDGHVGLRTGVGLDVGVFGSEEAAGAIAGEVFDDVNVFASAIVTATGESFGVFVREDRAGRFHNGGAGVIFRGDQLQAILLALGFRLNTLPDFGITRLEHGHSNQLPWIYGQIWGYKRYLQQEKTYFAPL